MNIRKILIVAFFFSICTEIFSYQCPIYHRSAGYRFNKFSAAAFGAESLFAFFIFGFDGYSEATVMKSTRFINWEWRSLWTLHLSPENSNTLVEFGSSGRLHTLSFPSFELEFQGNSIVAFREFWDDVVVRESFRIENTDNFISIDARNVLESTFPPWNFTFSNIPGDELLRIYLMFFLRGAGHFLDSYEYALEDIRRLLGYLTSRELAIFRNYIFARHNFAFRTQLWNNFFREHYREYFAGTRTAEEVMAVMTEREERILNMIVEIERQH